MGLEVAAKLYRAHPASLVSAMTHFPYGESVTQCLERITGFEPVTKPWQGLILPLYYIRLVDRVGIEPTDKCLQSIQEPQLNHSPEWTVCRTLLTSNTYCYGFLP